MTTVITAISNGDIVDRYHTSGSGGATDGLEGAGRWRRRRTKRRRRGSDETHAEQILPPELAKGQPQDVIDVEALKKKTRPPKRFTEATLLTAMETAGKTLDEKELSEAMKETRPRHACHARGHHRGAA